MAQGKDATTGERRKYVRYACKTELKAIVDFNPGAARRSSEKLPPVVFRRGETGAIMNISEKGVSIRLEHFLPEGMMLKMAIENPVTPPIETNARVVWAKRLRRGRQGYVMGMAFRNMRVKHRRNLERLFDFLQRIPE